MPTFSTYQFNKTIKRRLIKQLVKAYNWNCILATKFLQSMQPGLFTSKQDCNNADYEQQFLN